MPERPLRIAFVAYRGNMACGGQGVYLWFLAREMARLGHEVDVFVGPPYPDPMPFAEVEHLPNQEFWGRWFSRDIAGMVPAEGPVRHRDDAAELPFGLVEVRACEIEAPLS